MKISRSKHYDRAYKSKIERKHKTKEIETIKNIEDLIVEIISNSLLSNDAKCVILKNLEELISEKELGDVSEEQQSMESLKKGETTGFKISKMIKTSENAISTIISWVGIVAAILSSAISTGEITEIFSSIDLSTNHEELSQPIMKMGG